MAQLITFDNKVTLDPKPEVADINKGRSEDWNEIKSKYNEVVNELNAGTVGKYDLIACVIRKVGSTWEFVGGAHSQINCASVAANAGNVLLTFNKTYSKAVSLLCTPDGELAKEGITMGASVGLSTATITLYAANSSAKCVSGVDPNNWTLNFAESHGVFTPSWNAPTNSARVGIQNELGIELKHGASVVSNNAAYRCIITDVQNDYIDVQFVDNTGTVATAKDANMDFSINAAKPGLVNASTVVLPTSSNIWIWGIMEI